ncbi:MAG: hypothetical protein CSA65_01050 [Proteobacteria bacterium]|nr:MAG: hypothetical protein CSA65_01050 [Pseudomonadota bacterium]
MPLRLPLRRLLVVAPDPRVRERVAEGAARIPDAEVTAVSTLAAAKTAILKRAPHLVLSSLALPDSDNLQLFKALTSREINVPTTFMSRCLRRFREHLGVLLRADDLEAELGRELQCDCGDFSRRPLALSLADGIALGALSQQDVSLELLLQDQIVGVVTLSDGQLCSAIDGEGEGLDALERLLGLGPALLTCRATMPNEPSGPSGAVSIGMDWRAALCEYADERWRRDLREAPNPDDRREDGLLRTPLCVDDALADVDEGVVDARLVDAPFDQLLEEGLDAVLDRRLDDAHAIFTAAGRLRPEDPRIVANLARLLSLRER